MLSVRVTVSTCLCAVSGVGAGWDCWCTEACDLTEEPLGTLARSVSRFWITLLPAASAGGTSLLLLLRCISPALQHPWSPRPDLLSCYRNNQERAVFSPRPPAPCRLLLTEAH